MKKVLFVYPHNFLIKGMGTNVRVKRIAEEYIKKGYAVDQLAFDHFMPGSVFENFENDNSSGLINELFLYDCSKDSYYTQKSVKLFFRVINMFKGEYIHSWVSPKVKKYFNSIIANNKYESIIVVYSYLAYLLKGVKETSKIYLMDDCVFMQQYNYSQAIVKRFVTPGKLFDSDINLCKMFDKILSISIDEALLYERFLGNKVFFFPHIMQPLTGEYNYLRSDKKTDLFYLGFDSPNNLEGLNWFFDNVYEHLNKDIQIVVGGSVTKNLNYDFPNVKKISFVEDLEEQYADSRLVICPMLNGTGMKTKVIEAIQRGIPVVCTSRGVDGFPDKTKSGCLVSDDPIQFAKYINEMLSNPTLLKKQSDMMIEYFDTTLDGTKYIDLLDN